MIRLCLEIRPSFPNQAWHCAWVEVRRLTGEGKTEAPSEVQTFLCDRWLRPEDGTIELRSDKCKSRFSALVQSNYYEGLSIYELLTLSR